MTKDANSQKHSPTSFALVGLMVLCIFSGATASASSSIECRALLSRFLKERTSERQNWSEEMQKHLDAAAEVQGVDSVPYSEMERLVPLFNSGIVHRAIAQEFAKRNHKTESEIGRAMAAFPYLAESEQIDFVDDVVVRLLYTVSDTVSLSGSQLAKVEKEALSYGMTIDTYLKFVQAWTTQRASNYISIKIAILQNLLSEDKSFVGNVKSYGTTWYRRGSQAGDKKLVAPPKRIEMSFSQLVLTESQYSAPYPDSVLSNFFTQAPKVGIEYFLESHYQFLILPQLKELIENKGNYRTLFEVLSPELQAHIQERLELLLALSEKNRNIVQKLNEVEGALKEENRQLRLLKAELENVTTPKVKPVNSDEFVVILNMLEKSEALGLTAYLNQFQRTFNTYLARLSSAEVFTLFETALKFAPIYNQQLQVMNLFNLFHNLTRSFSFASEDVVQIKVIIKSKILVWTKPQEIQKGLDLMDAAWGIQASSTPPPQSPEAVQKQIDDAVNRVSQLTNLKTSLTEEIGKFKATLDVKYGVQLK